MPVNLSPVSEGDQKSHFRSSLLTWTDAHKTEYKNQANFPTRLQSVVHKLQETELVPVQLFDCVFLDHLHFSFSKD